MKRRSWGTKDENGCNEALKGIMERDRQKESDKKER